jgi:small GTP-binding protein
MADSRQSTFKIVALGSSGVGKSSIIQRLVSGSFNESRSITCGADFFTHPINTGGDTFKLQIWDTAGQERFRAISKAYFRCAAGAILVFDITDHKSFEDLQGWLNDLQRLALPNAYVLLVANKCDLDSARQVGASEIKVFSEMHQLNTIETSALSGLNIETAFTRLTSEIVTRIRSGELQALTISASGSIESISGGQTDTKGSCC